MITFDQLQPSLLNSLLMVSSLISVFLLQSHMSSPAGSDVFHSLVLTNCANRGSLHCFFTTCIVHEVMEARRQQYCLKNMGCSNVGLQQKQERNWERNTWQDTSVSSIHSRVLYKWHYTSSVKSPWLMFLFNHIHIHTHNKQKTKERHTKLGGKSQIQPNLNSKREPCSHQISEIQALRLYFYDFNGKEIMEEDENPERQL